MGREIKENLGKIQIIYIFLDFSRYADPTKAKSCTKNIQDKHYHQKKYRELLGSAISVFNSNNRFVIEYILRIDSTNYNWYDLIDKTSGQLNIPIKNTITKNSNEEIALIFESLINKRNRIIHSFQVTHEDIQILATKDKENKQFIISKEYLLDSIKENELLSSKLYELRSY